MSGCSIRRVFASIAFAALPLCALQTALAEPIPIAVRVLDDPGEGFNDPVLGPARLAAMHFAADLWGSFFETTFAGQKVNVDVSFDAPSAAQGFVAFSSVLAARPPRANFQAVRTQAENFFQRSLARDPDLRHGSIVFNNQENFFLGTTGSPPANALDFVTFALHELGHIFGFYSALDASGDYVGVAPGFPSFYDFFVYNAAGRQLVNLSPAERIAAATSGNGLFWGGENGVAENGGVRPNLSAGTTYNRLVNVVHTSDTFGPDVLMDPNKFFGESIHGLSPMERGMFEDLAWALAPLRTVPEPATWLLFIASMAALGLRIRHSPAKHVS